MKFQRTCCVCRKKKLQSQMLKITKEKDGKIYANQGNEHFGRSTYVCSCDCLNKLINKKILNKVFRCVVDNNVYETLTRPEISDILKNN